MDNNKITNPVPGQPIFKRPARRGSTAPPSPPNPQLPKPSRREAIAPSKRSGWPAGSGLEMQYLKKHAEARTPMVVVLKSGSAIRGRIAWIDTYSIKIERKPAEPNVLIFKSAIAYIHRAENNGDG